MAVPSNALQQYVVKGRRRTPTVRRIRELLRVTVVQRLLRGDVLPSEWELVTTLDVSRGVVREALDLLRGEGLIDRLQGAGTFVVSPERAAVSIEEMGGMVRGIDDGAARMRWDLLELEVLPAPRLIAERLQLEEGAEVVYAERRQNIDGEPTLLRSSWMPPDIGAVLRDDPTSGRRSLYDLFELALGHSLGQADLRVEATLVDASTAGALGVVEGAPLLLLERLVYDVHGRPVEYGHSRMRADRAALTTVMGRTGVEAPARTAATGHSLAGNPRKRMRLPCTSDRWTLQRTS
jgi:GntR family transcriptional regulator